MNELIIGLDVGTTAAKAVLFDLNGIEICNAEKSYPLHTPQNGWVEQNADEIWEAVLYILKTVISEVENNSRILAISLATLGGSLVPCKKDGTSSYPIITWMDNRATDLVQEWRAAGICDQVKKISGWMPEPGLPLSMIGWLERNNAAAFHSTDYFLSVNDFLTFRLAGQFVMNPSMAGEMLLTDISTGKWDEDMCQLVGIRSDQLSPIQPSDAVIGPITQETCRQTGLAQGTVLINGGQDHSCEALAVGMITKGKAMLACGTAWVINSVIEDLAADSVPEMMNVNFHVLPDLWTISQFLGGLGAASEWWLNQCWQSTDPQTKISREALYSNFNKALADTSPGCNGLTFHPLSGSMQFSSGLDSGGFLGLRLAHSRADMSRAVMEGAAYELRWALEPIKNTGMVIDQLWMIGGAARSRIWTQIVADVSGVQISLSPYSHGPALGAAILAGAGLGIHNTIDESRARFSVTAEHVHPQAKNLVVYETAFREYQQLTKRLHQKRG